jgi:uncharacterized membrane protein
MSLISILLVVAGFAVLFWVVQSVIPIPQPFRWIALAVIGVFLALFLFGLAGYGPGISLH